MEGNRRQREEVVGGSGLKKACMREVLLPYVPALQNAFYEGKVLGMHVLFLPVCLTETHAVLSVYIASESVVVRAQLKTSQKVLLLHVHFPKSPVCLSPQNLLLVPMKTSQPCQPKCKAYHPNHVVLSTWAAQNPCLHVSMSQPANARMP